MLIQRFLNIGVAVAALVLIFTVTPSCGGAINPALGARLIFEEEIADGLTGQIILQDMDLLGATDDDNDDYDYDNGT